MISSSKIHSDPFLPYLLQTEFKRLSSLNNPRVQELQSFYREQLQCLGELHLAAVDEVGGEGRAAETTSVQVRMERGPGVNVFACFGGRVDRELDLCPGGRGFDSRPRLVVGVEQTHL